MLEATAGWSTTWPTKEGEFWMVDVAVAGAEPADLTSGDAPALLSEHVLVTMGASSRSGLNAREARINDGAATAADGHPCTLRRPVHLRGQAQNEH